MLLDSEQQIPVKAGPKQTISESEKGCNVLEYKGSMDEGVDKKNTLKAAECIAW